MPRSLRSSAVLVPCLAAVLLAFSAGCSSGGASDWSPPEVSASHIEAANAFWGLTYETPADWRATERGLYTVLSTEGRAGEIVVGRWAFTTPEEASAAVATQWRAAGITAPRAVEAPAQRSVAGLRAMVTTYAFEGAPGVEERIRFVALFTDYGTTLAIWGRAPAAQFEELRATVDALAATTKAAPPTPNRVLMKELVGRWRHDASAETASTFTFDPSGSFVVTHDLVATPGDAYAHASTADGTAHEAGTFVVIGSSLVLVGKSSKEIWTVSRTAAGVRIGAWEYRRTH